MIPFEPFDKIQGAFLGRESEDAGEEFFQVQQVHGDRIVVLKNLSDKARLAGREADAVICARWGVPIAVRTADCVPILIAHPSRLVAAVHAGWRGTRAAILEKTLIKMRDEFQVKISELSLAIGPAIGSECYEVGPEVAEAFTEGGMAEFCLTAGPVKFKLDLRAANAAQARRLGIPEAQIETHPDCTRCREDLYFSHRGAMARGEAKAGRNYSWVMISP